MTESTKSIESILMEVLEQQACLFGTPVDCSELPDRLLEGVEVSLDFHGDRSGRIVLTCSNELSLELAANVLGLDDPDDVADEDAEDALKELANVMAGQVLASVAEEKELFKLDAPQLTRDHDGSIWASMKVSDDVHALMVEDYPALVQLSIQ